MHTEIARAPAFLKQVAYRAPFAFSLCVFSPLHSFNLCFGTVP